MTPTITTTRLGKALAGALAAGALLVPVAQAKPTPGATLRASDGAFERAVIQTLRLDSLDDVSILSATDGAFERAVIRQQAGSTPDYRDAQHATSPTSGAALYSDTERALHLRTDAPVAGGGSGDSFDWHLLATLSSMGALAAVLAAGTLLALRQRERLV